MTWPASAARIDVQVGWPSAVFVASTKVRLSISRTSGWYLSAFSQLRFSQ